MTRPLRIMPYAEQEAKRRSRLRGPRLGNRVHTSKAGFAYRCSLIQCHCGGHARQKHSLSTAPRHPQSRHPQLRKVFAFRNFLEDQMMIVTRENSRIKTPKAQWRIRTLEACCRQCLDSFSCCPNNKTSLIPARDCGRSPA